MLMAHLRRSPLMCWGLAAVRAEVHAEETDTAAFQPREDNKASGSWGSLEASTGNNARLVWRLNSFYFLLIITQLQIDSSCWSKSRFLFILTVAKCKTGIIERVAKSIEIFTGLNAKTLPLSPRIINTPVWSASFASCSCLNILWGFHVEICWNLTSDKQLLFLSETVDLFWIVDHFVPLYVPWAALWHRTKNGRAFPRFIICGLCQTQTVIWKGHRFGKRFKSAHKRKIHLDRRNLKTGK